MVTLSGCCNSCVGPFVKTKGTPAGQHWLRGLGADAIQPEFGMTFHDLRRLRLQDRIGIITGELEDVAGAVRAARPVDQRRGPRCQRLEPGKRMHPEPREGARFINSSATPACREQR